MGKGVSKSKFIRQPIDLLPGETLGRGKAVILYSKFASPGFVVRELRESKGNVIGYWQDVSTMMRVPKRDDAYLYDPVAMKYKGEWVIRWRIM